MIAHPAVSLLRHDFSRTDLFSVTYCLVDDWMKQRFGSSNAPRKGRSPRPSEFCDSEVLTVLLVGELCHCLRERAWLRQVRSSYRFLFPALPEDSRFSRRAEQVRSLLRDLRQAILFWADADLEPLRLLDSFPMPLCACYRVHQSTMPISGSWFGYNASKEEYFFGLHPALLITGSGFIDDLILAPGNCHDAKLLALYLDECVQYQRAVAGQDWVADKGFGSKPLSLGRSTPGYQPPGTPERSEGRRTLLCADLHRQSPKAYRGRDLGADGVLWDRASAGQDRLGHLSQNPGQGDRLLPGKILQQGLEHTTHEHRTLRCLN